MAVIAGAGWEQIRSLIETQTGTVREVKPINERSNPDLAAIVRTDQETFFVKGRRREHPRAWTLACERTINPAVRHVSPWLRWSASGERWNLLGFEYITGWPANYRQESPDLPKIVRMLLDLQRVECPDVEMMTAEQRWAAYTDTPDRFMGGHLLHTDWSPGHVLVNGRAYLVGWGWPTRGAAWIDPACWVVRLIAAGHPPMSAEAWAQRIPSWKEAWPIAIDDFARVQAAVWSGLAARSPGPQVTDLANGAHLWARYRAMRRRKGL